MMYDQLKSGYEPGEIAFQGMEVRHTLQITDGVISATTYVVFTAVNSLQPEEHLPFSLQVKRRLRFFLALGSYSHEDFTLTKIPASAH